jgi:hypothetical protein
MPRTVRNSSAGKRRRGDSGSRRPQRASGRKGTTAGSTRNPLTRSFTLAFAGIPACSRAVAVNGKERKGAKSGGEKKVHLVTSDAMQANRDNSLFLRRAKGNGGAGPSPFSA